MYSGYQKILNKGVISIKKKQKTKHMLWNETKKSMNWMRIAGNKNLEMDIKDITITI